MIALVWLYHTYYGILSRSYYWGARIEEAFETGASSHPLQATHKGSTSYTDKFEADHPGVTQKIFRYAQQTVGNQVSYTQIANVMNLDVYIFIE